jgi:hypothetical protein
MYQRRIGLVIVISGFITVLGQRAFADSDANGSSAMPTPASLATPSDLVGTRFGPFGLFDTRSQYGTGFFPEPFLVDEGDLDREFVVSSIHEEGANSLSSSVTAEVEWSFHLLTVEVEAPYEHDITYDPTGRTNAEGVGSPSVSFRHPIWQYVSPSETVDNTLVLACETAFPTNSEESHSTEIVPGFFDLLRIGDHFGFQANLGLSTLYGGDENHDHTVEYSGDFSWIIDDSEISLPKEILGIVPMIELAGERHVNHGDHSDELSGVAAVRFNLANIGQALPRLGVGYIFPIDKQAREEFHWGVTVSLVFDL